MYYGISRLHTLMPHTDYDKSIDVNKWSRNKSDLYNGKMTCPKGTMFAWSCLL